MKNNNKLSIIVTLVMAILCVGFVGLSGAWFADSDSLETTITLANGLQIEATGLKQNDTDLTGTLQNNDSYQLKLTNNSAVAPGATVYVEDVTLKIKSNSQSADAYLRFKLEYEYKEKNSEWQSGTYSECNLTNEISANLANSNSAGFVKVGDWYYFFKNSTANTYANLEVLTTNQVSLFATNQELILSESIPSGAEIRITLTIDAVQTANNAVVEEWGNVLS